MASFSRETIRMRPISAKQKKKLHSLTSPVSCSRLSRVQSLLCHNETAKDSSAIEGILCILGIDSRYNTGTKQLLNYLLFGYGDLRAESVRARLTDEDLEDLVVFIKSHSVDVYCNPLNYDIVLPLIGHWRNLKIHCVSTAEYEDDEVAEEFKIRSVVSMVKGCKVVGIPYGEGGGTQHKPFDPFAIEKWPVIQAFALEGMGGGGFFTMNHEVVDISKELDHIVYSAVDPVTMEILLTQTLPLFERNWKPMMNALDLQCSSGLNSLSQKEIGEAVMSFFVHGQQHGTSKGSSSPFHRKPYVLLGRHSSYKNISKPCEDHLCSDTTVANSGLNGKPAMHMVCQAVEPKDGLACARTYFFTNAFNPELPGGSGHNPAVYQDARILMDLYFLAIDGIQEAISVYVKTLSIKQSETALLGVLKRGFEAKKLSINSAFLSSHVDFEISAFDHLGRTVKVEDGKSMPVLKMACVKLFDIPSMEHSGVSLGSVVFGESFIDSHVEALDDGKAMKPDSEVLVLTHNIPKFCCWKNANGMDKIAQGKVEESLKDKSLESHFGSHLGHGDPVFITSTSSYSSWQEGSIYAFDTAVVFHHSSCGYIVIPKQHLSRIQIYDQDTTSVPALLVLTYTASLEPHLPAFLHCKDKNLLIAFPVKSRAHRLLYGDVMTSWTKPQPEGVPALATTSDLEKDVRTQYDHFLAMEEDSKDLELADALHKLPGSQQYLSHLQVSSTHGSVPVKKLHLSELLGQKQSEESESPSPEIIVSVLTGLPGSGKEKLCSSLLSLAKENSRWIVLRRSLSDYEPFSANKLQNFLTSTLTNHKMHTRLTAGNKKLRVIIVTPGFTDVKDVCEAILGHPNPSVGKLIQIGAVTCCVDPKNTFITHRLALPKLLEQCAQGWVNNVVFTSCLGPGNEQLAVVQQLVRACNPDAAHILAKGGEVTRNADVELIMSEESFINPVMVQQRHFLCPGWPLGRSVSVEPEPLVQEVCLAFYQPLDKDIFFNRLKEIRNSEFLCEKEQSSGSIYGIRGNVIFSGSNELNELEWVRLVGMKTNQPVNLMTVPRPPSAKNAQKKAHPDSFLIFTGFHLNEKNLKEWLRTCVKPKPKKKTHKSRKDLSKKELDEIKAKHKCTSLPEGWFFTGVQYVSFTGDKTFNHPLLEEFINDYLQQENEEIDKHNKAIDLLPDLDLFQES